MTDDTASECLRAIEESTDRDSFLAALTSLCASGATFAAAKQEIRAAIENKALSLGLQYDPFVVNTIRYVDDARSPGRPARSASHL